MARPPSDLSLLGQVLDGRYRVEALLGHGGMGAVYRAHHVHLEQRFAIKVLRPHLAGDPTAARRFAREARGTFKLETEHAVRVADFGVTDAGLLYMVMEYLDGRTVHDELAVDGSLAPARAVRIAAQVCDALAAAHRLGFAHRDIKPENVMLVRRGADPDFVKVLDFGLAKLIEGAGGGSVFSVAALTQHDMVFGTPEYMAPEQAMGHALDGRADLYAVGATLFEMLAGRPPFVDASPMKLLTMHVKAPPPAVRAVAPAVVAPDALEALIARCLAKAPEDRPQSAEELAATLRALEPSLSTIGALAFGAPGSVAGPAPARAGAPRIPAALAASATIEDLAFGAPDSVAGPAPARSGDVDTPPPARAPSAATDLIATRGLRRSTRLLLALIGVAAIGVAAVVALALTRSRRPAARTEADTEAPIEAPDARAAVDAAHPDAAVASAPTPDAAPAPRPKSDRREDPALQAHLAAAERARRAGNRLRQLAEADAALGLDPRHVRARFLIGEALLETGDVANGCRYLRSAKRIAEARALVASGRCPAD